MRNKRVGFTIVEISIAMVVIGIIYMAFIKSMNTVKEDVNVASELSFYNQFENGMKNVFLAAVDASEILCTNVADSANVWGWNHPSCNLSNPYPSYLASVGGVGRILQWKYNFTGAGVNVKNAILGEFGSICRVVTNNNTTINLQCPKLLSLKYDTGGGFSLATPMLATPRRINPFTPPGVQISYERSSTIGNLVSTELFQFTMQDVYDLRRGATLVKFNDIRTSLTTYHKTKTYREVGNPPPEGLHSMDDEFIPWFWLSFGDNLSLVPPLCSVGTCATLSGSNFWRTTLSGKALFMNRISGRFFSGAKNYFVDGFGNALFLIPSSANCAASTDFSTCTTIAPPLAAAGYINGITTPPYSSILYIDGYSVKANASMPYTRAYITY